ncbi:MAG: serine/threonine-protein kinase, partial [Pseudonocardiales bacterium]|nr:serine/threonine-protein kinase [Pseudonocardiales bacterium]
MTTTGAVEEPAELLGGRYALGDVLGVGGTAVVYRARDVRTEAPVAVKLFPPSPSAGDRRRQLRELQALTRLDHPGLVRLLDADTTGEHPYLVTEVVEGPSLADALVGGPLPPAEVARMGADLAAALASVHAGGFVHRDVKPGNVLLERGLRPRLADFGIARALDGATATTAGAVVGTAAYMAPEQVRGRPVGPAADVYALGLVLLEALTGRREYPGAPIESAIARLTRAPAVPAGLPRPLASALAAMTRTDPVRRPDAARAATLLGGALGDGTPADRTLPAGVLGTGWLGTGRLRTGWLRPGWLGTGAPRTGVLPAGWLPRRPWPRPALIGAGVAAALLLAVAAALGAGTGPAPSADGALQVVPAAPAPA